MDNNMPDNEYLKTLLDTFDLDNKRKEKLFSLFSHRLDNFYTYVDLYRYVTDLLLNKYNTPTNFIRLDQKIKWDSKRTFHDIIGVQDNNLESLLNQSDEDDKLTINDVFSILREELDDVDYSILEQLMPKTIETKLNLNYATLMDNLPEIQKRIEIITKSDGKEIIIPHRPVIEIKFTDKDFKIIFGSRRYNGNPLAYFLEHYSDKNLTRHGLEKLDQPLYNALRRQKQLEAAIPFRIRNYYDGNPLAHFREKYKNRKIGRWELGRENSGLYTSLLDAGQMDEAIPEKKRGKGVFKYKDGDYEKIIEAYKTYDGKAFQSARHMPYTIGIFIKYWKRAGLDIRKPGKQIKLA